MVVRIGTGIVFRALISSYVNIVASDTFRNTAYVLTGTAGSAFIRFCISLIFASQLTAHSWGVLVVAIGLMDILSVLTDGGLNPTLVQFSAEQNKSSLRSTFAYALKLKILFSLGWVSVFFAGRGWIERTFLSANDFSWLYPIAIIGGVVLSFNGFFISVFQAVQKFGRYAALTLLLNSLRIIFVLMALVWLAGYEEALIVGFFVPIPLVAFATATAAWSIIRSAESRNSVNRPAFRSFLWPLVIFNAISITTQRADVFVLSYFRDAAEVGAYGVAFQFAFLLPLIGSALFSALLPKVSGMNKEALRDYSGRALRLWPVVAALTVVAGILGPLLATVLFGQKYDGVAPVLALLTAGLGAYLMVPPLIVVLYGLKKTWHVTMLHIGQLGCMLTLDLLLVPAMGAIGASMAVLVSRLLMVAAVVWWTRRLLE